MVNKKILSDFNFLSAYEKNINMYKKSDGLDYWIAKLI